MKTNTMRSAGSIRSILFLAALQLSPSIILAAETPKEIVTTQGYFSLTENGLPEQETIPAWLMNWTTRGQCRPTYGPCRR